MSETRKRLRKIYRDDNKFQEAVFEVDRVLSHYKRQNRSYELSHKDIVLISYPDQVVEPSEASILTLKKFMDRNLDGYINSIHILPFYPYSSDDGFSVSNYYEVAPNFGSWKDINSFGAEYRLMFDGVINHISSHSKWFEHFLKGDSEYQDFFIEKPPHTDISKVVRPRTSPLLSEFKDTKDELRYLWTTFSRDQIDLNYQNPKVLAKMIDVLLFYIHHGAKILRLDAIAFLWKDENTSSIHLPETHEIIKLIRAVIDLIAPDTIIVSETNVPHIENISYFGNGSDEAHLVYNFALPPLLAFSILKGNSRELQKWAESLEFPSKEVSFFNFNASHDGVGVRAVSSILKEKDVNFLIEEAKKNGAFISHRTLNGTKSPYEINCSYLNLLSSQNESETDKLKKMVLAQAITFAMPGVPSIYFQTLVGGENYYHGVEKSGSKRAINRERYYINKLEEDLEGNTLKSRIFKSMKQLLSVRKSEKSFHPFGDFQFKQFGSKLFVISRSYEKESILAIHNLTSETLKLEIPKEFRDGLELFSNKKVGEHFSIDNFGIAWIKSSRNL
jgi:sucrose phosphorylase